MIIIGMRAGFVDSNLVGGRRKQFLMKTSRRGSGLDHCI